MILSKQSQRFSEFDSNSFITSNQLYKLFDKRSEFKDSTLEVFNLSNDITEVFQIGNAKQLVEALIYLDSLCEKIDIDTKIRNVELKKLLESEKAIFEIFNIENSFIIKQNKSDRLEAETRYSAKNDILDYFSLSKFANYCRDNGYDGLIENIKVYLRDKNVSNHEEVKLRLIYVSKDEKFYIRAKTSTHGYKDFGLNFSVFVAIVALDKYVKTTKNEIFIDNFVVDDSKLYVSFSFKNTIKLSNNLNLNIGLVLENDEIKRNSVSFNGVCKLSVANNQEHSEVFIKPKGILKDGANYPIDLLTYSHRGSVRNVFEKIEELPALIEVFIQQVSTDAPYISNISKPDDIRKFIAQKIKNSKKPEFKIYKQQVFNKLMKITVDNTFKLFELLRTVEELFEHDDVVSRDFWREKLYEALIEKK